MALRVPVDGMLSSVQIVQHVQQVPAEVADTRQVPVEVVRWVPTPLVPVPIVDKALFAVAEVVDDQQWLSADTDGDDQE